MVYILYSNLTQYLMASILTSEMQVIILNGRVSNAQ